MRFGVVVLLSLVGVVLSASVVLLDTMFGGRRNDGLVIGLSTVDLSTQVYRNHATLTGTSSAWSRYSFGISSMDSCGGTLWGVNIKSFWSNEATPRFYTVTFDPEVKVRFQDSTNYTFDLPLSMTFDQVSKKLLAVVRPALLVEIDPSQKFTTRTLLNFSETAGFEGFGGFTSKLRDHFLTIDHEKRLLLLVAASGDLFQIPLANPSDWSRVNSRCLSGEKLLHASWDPKKNEIVTVFSDRSSFSAFIRSQPLSDLQNCSLSGQLSGVNETPPSAAVSHDARLAFVDDGYTGYYLANLTYGTFRTAKHRWSSNFHTSIAAFFIEKGFCVGSTGNGRGQAK